MKAYLSEEQIIKKRKYRRLKTYLALFFILALFFAAFYAVVKAPLFKVEAIDVSGLSQLSRGDLLNGLETEIIKNSRFAALLGSGNLLFWKKEEAEKAAGAFPTIKSLDFERDFNRRAIRIVVKEREKKGIWCAGAVKCYWFDDEGVIFKEAPRSEGFIVFKVDDFSGRLPALGMKVLEGDFFGNFFKIVDELLRLKMTIQAIAIKDIRFQEFEVLTGGPKLLFSFRFYPKSLGEVLVSLKEEPSFSKWEYIDFRVENRVYYKN